MTHRHVATGDIVHTDRAPLVVHIGRTVHEDDRDAQLSQPRQVWVLVIQSGDQDATHPQFREALQVPILWAAL